MDPTAEPISSTAVALGRTILRGRPLAQPALDFAGEPARPADRVPIDPEAWEGSSLAEEASLQQLAPFVGKMKCTMAAELTAAFSPRGGTVLDPFCGCGVVPLESLILGRSAIANDLHPYAYTVTRAKLTAPPDVQAAGSTAERYLQAANSALPFVRLEEIPAWVRKFFHPDTLRETIALTTLLCAHEQWFLLGCVLGILHHVRPGFLSYPTSHLTPYLRERKYPREEFAEMYAYRDVRSRLLAKVGRMYRRPVRICDSLMRSVTVDDARELSLRNNAVDAIITSPPYFDALDYARDNRLRLWFLGVPDYRMISPALITTPGSYLQDMATCLSEMHRVLRPGCYCVLVLGDVEKDGRTRNTAELLASLVREATPGFVVEGTVADAIPDIRRSRRRSSTTKVERILILRKPR